MGFGLHRISLYLISILSPWASPESLPLPLRPFSGITSTHIRECGGTRKSFSHTFRENHVWCDFTHINQQSNINFTVYRKLLTTANRRNIAPCCCRSVFTRIFGLFGISFVLLLIAGISALSKRS